MIVYVSMILVVCLGYCIQNIRTRGIRTVGKVSKIAVFLTFGYIIFWVGMRNAFVDTAAYIAQFSQASWANFTYMEFTFDSGWGFDTLMILFTFHDQEFGLDLYRLKNFGIRGEEVIDSIGANAKMNEFQAAMGLCNLRHVDEEIEKRKKVFEKYMELLSGVDGIQLLKPQKDVQPNYAYFPVVFHEKEFGSSRNEVCEALKAQQIFARKYFYPLTNTFDCFNGMYDVNETPTALHISKRVLTLPMYADLKEEDVERICGIILEQKR